MCSMELQDNAEGVKFVHILTVLAAEHPIVYMHTSTLHREYAVYLCMWSVIAVLIQHNLRLHHVPTLYRGMHAHAHRSMRLLNWFKDY